MLAALLAFFIATPLFAQQAPPAQDPAQVEQAAQPDAAGDERLPEASITQHALAFEDRTLRFQATAGSIALTNAQGQPEADVAYVAYTLDTKDPDRRPVTFAVNGGPGAASAYLHFGALGPWRLPMEGEGIVPSGPVALVPNAETWLDFTDLVFIDPVGTGFSRLVNPDDALRERYLAVDGDIEAISDFIYRWLVANGRVPSPKHFVGESYGGFRGPLVAEALQTDYGMGLSGLTLLSPVLDFGWWLQPDTAPLPYVSLLPSLAATGMETEGAFAPEALAEAEAYSAGAYVTDFLRGVQDEAAVARMVGRVSELTTLAPEVVERHAGRIDARVFATEIFRDEDRLASLYDATVAGDDPAPARPRSRAPDPVLDALTAPLTGAALVHYRQTLRWLPDRRYVLLNPGVNRAWSWGDGRAQPEAVGALTRVLALDERLQLLVTHGHTDLVTPYFASTLILRQIRDFGPDSRVRQRTYRGGHMFYTRDDSRRAFRDDVRSMYRDRAN